MKEIEEEWLPSDTIPCCFCGKIKHTSLMGLGPGSFNVCLNCRKNPEKLYEQLYKDVYENPKERYRKLYKNKRKTKKE